MIESHLCNWFLLTVFRKLCKRCSQRSFVSLLFALLAISTNMPSLMSCCSVYKHESNINLVDNGYTDVVVGIAEHVDENHYLLERLKSIFTNASELLYNSTREKFYFKEITIVVPRSWKLEHFYDDFNMNNNDGHLHRATWQSYDRADMCIDEYEDFALHRPFVSNFANDCAQMASHITMTSNYVLHEKHALHAYGSYANHLVNNWAQFKYGVFTEHPTEEEEFYIDWNGDVEASRCGFNMTGSLRNSLSKSGKCEQFAENGLPTTECEFKDDQREARGKSASLMYKPHLNHINEFCDEDESKMNTFHNKYAPNTQNKECNYQSVWEVFRRNKDFRTFKPHLNPIKNSSDLMPKFRVLKRRAKHVVFMIDKTIQFNQRIEKVISDYIKNMLSDEDYLALIHFDNNARIVLSMSKVHNSDNRKFIMQRAIPTQSGEKKRNIWNAISLALSLIKSKQSNKKLPSGGYIVLLTDSKSDRTYPNIDHLIDQIKFNNIVFDMIQINGKSDENLESLSKETNGASFLLNVNNNKLLDIYDAFTYIANRDTSDHRKILCLQSDFFDMQYTSTKLGHVIVDDAIQDNYEVIKFTFFIDNVSDYLDLVVYEPNGRKHFSKHNLNCKDSSLFASDDLAKSKNKTQEIECDFKRPRVGEWTFEILNLSPSTVYVSLKVHAYLNRFEDELSYYSFNYERDNKNGHKTSNDAAANENPNENNMYKIENQNDRFENLKRKILNQQAQSGNVPRPIGTIKYEAKWSQRVVYYPEIQKLFVKLSAGLRPIVNATVAASIFRPSGDYQVLELSDNGLNADRYKDDGVYSAQFTSFSLNGSYHARIYVKTENDAKIDTQQVVGVPFGKHSHNGANSNERFVDIGIFQRSFYMGSFVLRNYHANRDLMKPGRIKDLRISEVNYNESLVKFEFTAPGDDGDSGKCFLYEIKCSNDLDFLIDDFDTGSDNSRRLLPIFLKSATFTNQMKPNPAGFKENFVLDVSFYTAEPMIGIKIRAIDASKNVGAWSFVMSVKLKANVTLAPKLRHFVSNSKDYATSFRFLQEKTFEKVLYIFFAILAVILIAQIAFLLVLIFRNVKKKLSLKPVRV